MNTKSNSQTYRVEMTRGSSTEVFGRGYTREYAEWTAEQHRGSGYWKEVRVVAE